MNDIRSPKHNGVVVDEEQVTRACGHTATLFHYEHDPHRHQRLFKMQSKRCAECGRKANEQHNIEHCLRARATVKKGQEVKLLPNGATFSARRLDDGTWIGSLEFGREIINLNANGLMSLLSKLARRFAAQHGAVLQGKVD